MTSDPKFDKLAGSTSQNTSLLQESCKSLRIVYTEKDEGLSNIIDLAVTPQALVYLNSSGNRHYLKPVDFISPQEIRDIKRWVVQTVIAMDSGWQKHGTLLPELIKVIGLDLCVLLETIKVADLVLTKIWSTNNFKHICTDPGKNLPNNMLQYEFPGYQYTDLLNDSLWTEEKRIKIVKNQTPYTESEYINKNVFDPPYWKKMVTYFLNIYRVSRQMKINLFSVFSMRLGITRPPIPSLFVVPNKDNSAMLQCQNSVRLHDYLTMLPNEQKKTDDLQAALINSIEGWFNKSTPEMEDIRLYKNIIQKRLTNFIRTRKKLLGAYIKMQNIKSPHSLKMILPSAIGCDVDAWSAMAIKENGGIVASTQHGGSYGSCYFPYLIFSDMRFNYFFSYHKPEISPIFNLAQEYGKAEWVRTGSNFLFKIRQACGEPPKSVRNILYIMNLCVPFYSSNFPWEFVLKQFQVLELLNSYGNKYTIHVKEEQTGTVQRSKYPKLEFINDSPKDVLHKYDLLILESGISTAVLEATVTNKYLTIFTGAEWEESSKEYLDMLSKRAECFDTPDDFLTGLKKILDDSQTHLAPSKLSSHDFMNTYCNPVPQKSYLETIKKRLELA
ncbi:MAG: hypothetical protein Q8K66_11540 [Sediminibacterium sp.]|nr:hypothetical protein [Sediminibacterium sp.]